MGEMSIGRAVTRLADAQPGVAAVRLGDEVLTRRDLDLVTNRIARRWVEGGMVLDDLVALMVPSDLDLVLAAIAVWKAGGTPMPLPADLGSNERHLLLAAAGPCWLVDGPVDRSPTVDDSALPDRSAQCREVAATIDSDGRASLVRCPEPATVDPDDPSTPHGPGPLGAYLLLLLTGSELVLSP